MKLTPLKGAFKRRLKRLLAALGLASLAHTAKAFVFAIPLTYWIALAVLSATAVGTGVGVLSKNEAALPPLVATRAPVLPPPRSAPSVSVSTAVPDAPGAGGGGAAQKREDDCEENALLMDAQAGRTARAAQAWEAAQNPPQFFDLVAKPTVRLDNPASALARLLRDATAYAETKSLVLNNVPIARIEELFDDFVTIDLREPVSRETAQEYARRLQETGYFTSVELDSPVTPSSVDYQWSYGGSTTKLDLWHMAGPGFREPPFNQSDDWDGIENGGSNAMRAWELLVDPAPLTVAVIERKGVAAPGGGLVPLLPGYNFVPDNHLIPIDKNEPKGAAYGNNQPRNVRLEMERATRPVRFQKRLWYTCGLCAKYAMFDGTGPNGWDWDATTTEVKDEAAFDSGTWQRKKGSHGAEVANLIGAYSGSIYITPGVVHNVRPERRGTRSTPNNQVRILPIRAGTFAENALAILWAAGLSVRGALPNDNPAKVINVSSSASAACPSYLQEAIDSAYKSGVVLIAGSGNEAERSLSLGRKAPANCTHVIAVTGNTPGPRPVLAPDANVAANTQISAPFGGRICHQRTGLVEPVGISVFGPKYGELRTQLFKAKKIGTSLSAPIVSGIVAMMLQVNAELSPDEVLQILKDTGRPFKPARSIRAKSVKDLEDKNTLDELTSRVKMVDGYAAVMAARDKVPRVQMGQKLNESNDNLLLKENKLHLGQSKR